MKKEGKGGGKKTGAKETQVEEVREGKGSDETSVFGRCKAKGESRYHARGVQEE